MTTTVQSLDDGTIGCCPTIPKEGLPTVLLVVTSGLACLRGRLTAESALRLGKALLEAGKYIEPEAAVWLTEEEELSSEL